jgi:hypothetical protein
MSFGNTTVNARQVYLNALDVMERQGITAQISKCTQSDLILENQLVVGTTQFAFPFLRNQNNNVGAPFNTEIRLNQQDSFVAAAWGVFLSNPASNVDATAPMLSFPNIFTLGAAAAAAAETIYNSIFQLSVNNDIILPVWSASRHRLVPQTQATAAFGAASPIDQVDLSSDGFVPVEPNLVIIGSKNNVLTLLLPAPLAAVSAFERIRVHFRGILAQNSTIIT